ncbi:MAG TPA: VacJ family lipoprotein [Ramlibacter sp.]|nr:VacJ family lipoprotein [Ramlibacter sp.]
MNRLAFRRLLMAGSLALPLLGMVGCATGPDRRDPFEPFNRKVASFNDAADSIVLKPVAIGYRNAVPALARTGVSNFFNNLSDGWSMVNSLLQLKIHNAAENWMRVSFNTVFGFAGVLDIASEMGIERHREDFGQTLGRWGMPTGPYLVLPILGPSTMRDTLALPVDRQGDPLSWLETSSETSLSILRIVDIRSNLLRAGDVLDEISLDKYRFTRDAYLQRRRGQIDEQDSSSGSSGAITGEDDGRLPDESGGAMPSSTPPSEPGLGRAEPPAR